MLVTQQCLFEINKIYLAYELRLGNLRTFYSKPGRFELVLMHDIDSYVLSKVHSLVKMVRAINYFLKSQTL